MKKLKLVAFIILCVFLLQILMPILMDINWNNVFAEDINTWDVSENGDGTVIATLSDDGILNISGNGKMKNYGNELIDYQKKGDNIKRVVINKGVTSIGAGAFYWCESLSSISIPEGVTSIGDYAFRFCKSLSSIAIPESVTSIGDYAFGSCESLSSISIPEGVTSIGAGAFYWCESLSSISIPEGVTSIGAGAFNSCTSLSSISIPEGVTSIGDHAFYWCKSLSSISIPEGVTSIGDDAFGYCTSLSSINVSSDNKNYTSDNGVLYTKDKTKLITYPAKKEDTKYTVLEGVTSIGDYAFRFCESLSSIAIPESVTSIGDYAFWSCESLSSISIPEGVTSIGESAFRSCTSLSSITIPEGVISIGDDAFYNCTSLSSINVSSDNKNYTSDNGVLYTKDKTKLITYPAKKEDTKYTVLEGVTSIGDYAFYYCESLSSISIPEGVTSIEFGAFEHCRNLSSITIPKSVTSIEDYAFYYCESLSSITIPEGVTSIESKAFAYCTSLSSINVSSDNKNYTSDNGVLYTKDKTKLITYPAKKEDTKYTVLEGVTSIENYAFCNCTSLSSISIPEGVTSIGSYAFEFCAQNLTIYCKKDSYAKKYAEEQKIKYILDDTAPTITNITGNEKWTKDKVTLTVNAKDELSGLANEAYSFDNGQTWQKENTKTYTENTKGIVVKVRDALGNIATQEIGTIKIDKQAPTITDITGNEKWTKDKVTLTVNAKDELSGLANEAYSFDNGQTWQKENAKTYTENTKGIIVKVRDALGNIATKEIGTIKIDKQAPTITNITGNEKWTKDKVTLTVNAKDELSGLANEAYSFDNGQTWQKENTKTYTENTKGIIVKVRDVLGNIATYKTIDINNVLKIEIKDYETIINGNEKYLTKINANTTISQLKEKIQTNGTVKILKGENEVTDSNTYVGTGMIIQVETEKYIAVVKGDLNGDGKIGLSDFTNIKFGLIGKKQLNTASQLAGDINGDGKMSLSDMTKLKMYLLGKVSI